MVFDLKDDDVLNIEDDVLKVLDVEAEGTTSSMSRTRSRTRSRTTTCVLDVEDVFDVVLDIEDLTLSSSSSSTSMTLSSM